jgi:hypothetical protein
MVGWVVLGLAAVYQFAWWNRYLAPTTGYELMFAGEFARGHLPYRDYYFPVQPGWVLASVAGVAAFGRHVIGFWLLGAIVRLASVWMTYRLAVRIGSPVWSGWLTLVAFAASCADPADFPPWYQYMTVAIAVAAAHAAVRCVESAGRGSLLWAAACGGLLGMEFLTKQTSGLLVGPTGVLVLFLAVGWRHGFRRAAGVAAVTAGVALIPCLAMAGWLAAEGAWPAYLDQVYLRGPSSKGGLWGALSRIGIAAASYGNESPAFVLAGLIWVVVGWVKVGPPGEARTAVVRTAAGTLAAVLVLFWGLRTGAWAVNRYSVLLAAAAAGFVGSLGLSLAALAAALRGRRDPATLTAGIAGGLAFAGATALALSWPVFPPMAWPGLAVSLAAVVGPTRRSPRDAVLRLWLAVLGTGVIVAAGIHKIETPSDWGFWREPPLTKTGVKPAVDELAGFELSPETAGFYEQVTAAVRSHSRPDDPILVFPNMPLLYGLADRPLATFCYMHWSDVCPDYVAEADAELLRRKPPAVIIAMDLPDEAWEVMEQAFRSGKRSGQRAVLEAINELTRTGYELVGSFPIHSESPEHAVSVRVWARRPAR